MSSTAIKPVGAFLREWRERRRLSQLALALDADVSARHVSFLETGRARPSREMLIRLAERLDVPLRERNTLLLAAGFAPAYAERPLDDPALSAVRASIDRVLAGHEPYPALAIDRHWTLIAANRIVSPLLTQVEPSLLQPPINVLRLSLHPAGLAPRIANLDQWRRHLLERLRHQVEATADAELADLFDELHAYEIPQSTGPTTAPSDEQGNVFVPLRLNTDQGQLALLSTTMVFGTPVDVTLAELAIEAFFPADAETAERLRQLAEPMRSPAEVDR